MKFKRLNTVLTLTSNIAVLIGIILVVIELRQNDDTLSSSIRLSLGNSYEELATFAVEHPHLARSIMRVFGGEELELADIVNIMAWQARYIQVLHTTYNLYRDGIVSEAFWREKASHFTVFMVQSDRFSQIYFDGRHDELYSRAFDAAIEEIYQEQLAERAETEK